MTLGENIVRLRTQKNWSQGDLADALDISRQSVSKWETDDLRTAVFPLRHHLLYGEASHGPVVRLGGLSLY